MASFYNKAHAVTKHIMQDEEKRKPYENLFSQQTAFKKLKSFVYSEVCKILYDQFLEKQNQQNFQHN